MLHDAPASKKTQRIWKEKNGKNFNSRLKKGTQVLKEFY